MSWTDPIALAIPLVGVGLGAWLTARIDRNRRDEDRKVRRADRQRSLIEEVAAATFEVCRSGHLAAMARIDPNQAAQVRIGRLIEDEHIARPIVINKMLLIEDEELRRHLHQIVALSARLAVSTDRAEIIETDVDIAHLQNAFRERAAEVLRSLD